MGWQPLKIERKKAKAKIVFKVLNNIGPKSLTNLFTYKGDTTSYNLRDISSSVCIPQPHTNSLKKVSCMMGRAFGMIFLKTLEKVIQFPPFETKSLLTLYS